MRNFGCRTDANGFIDCDHCGLSTFDSEPCKAYRKKNKAVLGKIFEEFVEGELAEFGE